MNKYIKQIAILVLVFTIILWIQNNDDKTKNKVRKNVYDKIKLPLLATAILGLFLNVDVEKMIIVQRDYINPNASINRIPMNPFNQASQLNNQDIYLSDFN